MRVDSEGIAERILSMQRNAIDNKGFAAWVMATCKYDEEKLLVLIVQNTNSAASIAPLLPFPAPLQPLIAPAPDAAIRTAALRVLQWAHRNSLLSPDAFFPGDAFDIQPVFNPPCQCSPHFDVAEQAGASSGDKPT